ncbi:hypothetical protein C8J56DRAFT_1029836 [Mycena floridula]|nr:hypothetical protein C8J56DRAFT_1029836 [Mycena floridula]
MSSASKFTIVSTDEDESLDSSTTLPLKKTGKAAFRERLKRIPKSTIVSHTLLYGLHVLLIFMHIVLLIVNHYGIAGSVKVKLGRATTILSISLSIGSQAFAIVYLTILLYITQKLSLRRILYSRAKTITGVHDRQSAWIGLGSAINSCWNQLSISASVWGVGIITVYLVLMAGLKITTPSLLGLASVPQNYLTDVNSTLNDPFLLESLQVSPPASVYGGSHTIRRDVEFELERYHSDGPLASPSVARLLHKLKSRDSSFGSGLLENMVYDVLKNNSGVGIVKVNSHTMNVSCVALSVSQYQSSITEIRPGDYVSFEHGGSTLPLMAPNVLKLSTDFMNYQLVLWTSFNVVDSMKKPAPWIRLNPPMNPFDPGHFYNFSNSSTTPLNSVSIHALNMSVIYSFNVSWVSTLSCSLTISNSRIPVSAETGLPLQSPERKTSSTWRHVDIQDVADYQQLPRLWLFLMTYRTSDVNISNPCDALIDSGLDGKIFGYLNIPACLSQAESSILDATLPSPVTNQSWKILSSDNIPPLKMKTVSLHELENAIEDYTAKLFWSTLYLSDLTNTSQVPVFMTETVSELQINLLPSQVITGLVLSIFLLIVAPSLVGWNPNERYKASVDNLGVLEILWLDGSREIADVEDPSTGNLRRAGMFASADLSTRRRWAD